MKGKAHRVQRRLHMLSDLTFSAKYQEVKRAVDPLLETEHSLWLQHMPGIPCHQVFSLHRRWLASICI